MNTETSTKPGTGGVTLHTIRWTPDATPRAEILLVHGYGEHSGRYEHVAQRLCDAGFAVTSLDHCGYGRTGRRAGTVDNFDLLVDDLASVVTDLSSGTSDGVPLFVYGLDGRPGHRAPGRARRRTLRWPDHHRARPADGGKRAQARLGDRQRTGQDRSQPANDRAGRRRHLAGSAVRADYDADPLNYRKVTTGTAQRGCRWP
ncbi:MAG: alpha/beta hydrolase [Candidatus Microthrix sp.]|nr:alpha/beta hydrolase [Candidatus Microthrix sp.]